MSSLWDLRWKCLRRSLKESCKELDIQVEPSEHSGQEIEILKSTGLVVFEDEVTGCVVRRESSRTEFAEQQPLGKGSLYPKWKHSEKAGRNQESGVVEAEWKEL